MFDLNHDKHYEIALPVGITISLGNSNYTFRTISAKATKLEGLTLQENINSEIEFTCTQNSIGSDINVNLTYESKSVYMPASVDSPLPPTSFYYIKPQCSINGNEPIYIDQVDTNFVSFPLTKNIDDGSFVYDGNFKKLLDNKRFILRDLKFYDKYQITIPYPNNTRIYPVYTEKYRLIHENTSQNLTGIITSADDINVIFRDEYITSSIEVVYSPENPQISATISKLELMLQDTAIKDKFFRGSIKPILLTSNLFYCENGLISIPLNRLPENGDSYSRTIAGLPCPNIVGIKIRPYEDTENGFEFTPDQFSIVLKDYATSRLIINVGEGQNSGGTN